MSQANVEIVRAIYAEWARGEFHSVNWAEPDIQFVLADGPTSGSWTGLAEMAAAWRDVLAAWDDFRAEAEDVRPLDDKRVLVLTRNSGRGRESGLDVRSIVTRGANVFFLRNGRVVRLVAYWDRERALADLGL
jgi:ketosteroid isomerase-like protein